VTWGAATTAQKNSWCGANFDRILFGAKNSNYSATFATAMALLNSTTDVMTAAVGSMAKQLAKQSGVSPGNPGVYNGRPKITPWEVDELDQEMYVCFIGDRAFKALQNDPTMYQANRDARSREGNETKTNPIFTGGALLYDGILYKNIPEITQRLLILSGTSGAAFDVEPYFLCGQAAMVYAMGQMPRPTTLEDGDYEFVTGLGIETQYGTAKVAKNPQASSLAPATDLGTLVDWGMVTGFVPAVPAA
jgi:hypothetical protein